MSDLEPAKSTDDKLADPGALRNTALRFAAQVATTAFTAGLTLYLVRALGSSEYGLYTLAYGVGQLLFYPASIGLPSGISRFLAEHVADRAHLRAILSVGLRLQLPAAFVVSAALFGLSGLIAHAYGHPRLIWPLRWMAIGVFTTTLFTFFTSVAESIRRVSIGLAMVVVESFVETSSAILLVIAGAGAAGAILGKALGFGVATVVGLYLTFRLLGGFRRRDSLPGESRSRDSLPERVGVGTIMRYSGTMLVVEVAWSATAQVDVLMAGAFFSAADVGSFGAVIRLVSVLGYLGLSLASGLAPRLASSTEGGRDVEALNRALRYLLLIQGLMIAPMVVWATPIVHLLLGSDYASAPLLRVMSVYGFVSAPGALLTGAITYLGQGRRRIPIMLGTLAIGVGSTYVLLRTVGLVGAAIADDLVIVVYVLANIRLCNELIAIDTRGLARCVASVTVAAAAMALVLWVLGTEHLSVADWLIGGVAGSAVYGAALFATRALRIADLRVITSRLPRART